MFCDVVIEVLISLKLEDIAIKRERDVLVRVGDHFSEELGGNHNGSLVQIGVLFGDSVEVHTCGWAGDGHGEG